MKHHLFTFNSKSDKKLFCIKFLLFCFLIIVIQLFFSAVVPISFKTLDELKANLKDTEIFLFGSSFNHWIDEQDKDKRYISQIVNSLQQKKVHGISKAAFNLEIFHGFINYISKTNYTPQLFIVEINLRSFSPEWEMRPEYEYKIELQILNNDLQKIFYELLSVFKDNTTEISTETFLKTSIYKGKEKVGVVSDFIFDDKKITSERIRKKFIFHYLSPVEKTHKQIIALKKIIELSKIYNFKILFYIPPVDYKSGEKQCPDEFISITGKSITFIKNIIEKNNSNVLDLSYSLTFDYFSDENYPYGHLNQKGRLFVANLISKWIDENLIEHSTKYHK